MVSHCCWKNDREILATLTKRAVARLLPSEDKTYT